MLRVKNAIVAVGVAVALTGAPAAAQEAGRMLTAPVGSMVNTVGTAIASVVTQAGNVSLGTSAMGGPQITVPQTNNMANSFTLLNAADAFDAFNNEGSYRNANTNLRLVSIGFQNPLGMITQADSDVQTADDIKGKRVTGQFSAHKTCETLATAQLQNVGLTWDDVTVVPVTHSQQAVKAVGEGRADVGLCVPIGQAVVKETNASTPIRFLSMKPSDEAAAEVRKLFPAGRFKSYEAGSSEGVVGETVVWNYPFYLVANKDTSDDIVYEVTKQIHDQIDDLRATSAVFNSWEPAEMASADINVPYHPGAIRFYEEQGMWTEEMQQASDKLLPAGN